MGMVEGKWLMVETGEGTLRCAVGGIEMRGGQKVVCAIRPESVRLSGDATENRFEATVRDLTYLGEVEQCALQLAHGAVWKAVEQNREAERQRGERVVVSVRPSDVVVVPE